MSKHEYNDLLFDISRKINTNELPRLVFMCRDDITEGSEDRIQDVLTLFKELEKENHLGIDRLDTLKEILTRMKKRSLLKKVKEFEIKRKAQSVGIISSLKRATGSLVGAVKLVCNFRTLAGGLVLVGSGLALRSCSTFEEYSDAFNKVVLPAFTKLVELGESSLCFTVQAETASALNELWKMYNNGTLKNRLQGFLVTEEVKQLAAGEDVEVAVFIDEEQYKEGYLNLMLLRSQASDIAEEERSTERRRKNSDSFLILTPKEDEVTLMKLKQAEIKLNFKIQILQKEIEKLKTEVAEEEPVQICKNSGKTAPEIKRLENPLMSRRRHSDSSLFCKARDQNIEESEKKEERFLGEEKYEFVQRYLQNVHDMHSATTETSDSGVKTHGAQSELGMEDISGDTHAVFFKDLNEDVIGEMESRIKVSVAARILQSFGIPEHLSRRFCDIFHLFPDTPVKLLRDVCEALQLYDLVDLLEKPISRVTKSLRPVLTLDEVSKLRKIDGRPTSYHSRAAVLIFADSEDNYYVKSYETFFKSLNNKSEVNIICERRRMKELSLRRAKEEVQRLNHSIRKVKRRYQWQKVEQQTKMMAKLTSELQMQRETVEQLEKELEEIEAKERKEEENVETAASKVLDRWIQRQDELSFFAVLDLSSVGLLSGGVISKLSSGIPNKTKFVGWLPKDLSETVDLWFAGRPPLSETLQVVVTPFYGSRKVSMLLLHILNKRWQTLDLVSMMDECRRSALHEMARDLVRITDTLSSLPRFKREEELS